MEISDIIKITYELIRSKEDRLIMGYEDDRALFLRQVERVEHKYSKMKNKFISLKNDYDDLEEKVTLYKQSKKSPTSSTNSKESPVKCATPTTTVATTSVGNEKTATNSTGSVLCDTSSPKQKRKPTAEKTHNVTDLILNDAVDTRSPKKRKLSVEKSNTNYISAKVSDSTDDWMENKSPQKTMILSGKPPVPTSRKNPIPLWSTVVASGVAGIASGSTSGIVAAGTSTISGTSSAKRVLKKHQSMIQLPSEATGLHNNQSTGNQPQQLQIAPKSSKTIHRSVTSHEGITSASSSSSYTLSHKNMMNGSRYGTTGSLLVSSSSNSRQLTASSRSNSRSNNVLTDSYKCIDVVRNKEVRDALPGHTCIECEKFYEAMEQQGVFSPGSKKARLQECSRHKAKWTPPTTPEGFWDLTVHTPEEWK